MAESIVSFVLGKIGQSAYQEALEMYGLGENVEHTKRQLKWLGTFLRDAEEKQNKNAGVKEWVKDVMEVSYMIEDALDKFLEETGGGPKNGVLQRACKMPGELYARRRIVSAMDNIKKRMAEIDENRQRLGILSIESSGATDNALQPIRPVVMVPEVDQMDVFGFKDDVNKICRLLLDIKDSRRSTISIVGAVGRGKTTVATKVYKSAEVERHFQVRIWLIISKEYQLIDILKKMRQKLRGAADAASLQQLDHIDCIRQIYDSLKGRRYLVVLDEVRSIDLWTQLKVALPEDNNGSRVLMTIRDLKVAEKVDTRSEPHELPLLDKASSIELLLRKAFPNRFADKCPANLFPLVNQFLQKCDGWPLALVVLGGLLSTISPDYDTWKATLLRLNWYDDDNVGMRSGSTIYDDLPVHLKPCFMYFALFPGEYEIEVPRLIQMWIAEGFIQQEPTKALEDTAKNYLEELVQRCLVQVSRRSRLGRMCGCRMHDILRKLAIDKARKNDFLTVYSKSTAANSVSTGSTTALVCRAAYHEFGSNGPVGAIGPNLRSLIYVGKGLPHCNKLRMSRVVDLETSYWNSHYNVLKLRWLKHLGTNLRYLRIHFGDHRQTNLSCLAHLKYLQMLDVDGLIPDRHNTFWNQHCSFLPCQKNSTSATDVSDDGSNFELPGSFWDNKMLRGVIWETRKLLGPPSSANLESMRRLEWVIAREEWAVKLPYFPHIRKLKVYLTAVQHCWEEMSNLMAKLENLLSLTLMLHPGEHMTVITPAFKDYEKLRSLRIGGTWLENAGIDGSSLPPNLVKLELEFSELKEDPMPELEKLPHLRLLVLGCDSYIGEKLVCSKRSFICLQQLKLSVLQNLEELEIEEGAMPTLNVLEISGCEKLATVPDLQHVKNLHELRLKGMSSVFMSKIKGEHRNKVKNVPSIITEL